MSEIKLLYHGFADEYRCQIIDWLYQKHSWKPEFIVGLNAESIRPWVASNYNECVLQDSMQLRMAQFNYKEIGDAVNYSEVVEGSMGQVEIAYKLMYWLSILIMVGMII